MSYACGLTSTITQSSNNYLTMCVPLINKKPHECEAFSLNALNKLLCYFNSPT